MVASYIQIKVNIINDNFSTYLRFQTKNNRCKAQNIFL